MYNIIIIWKSWLRRRRRLVRFIRRRGDIVSGEGGRVLSTGDWALEWMDKRSFGERKKEKERKQYSTIIIILLYNYFVRFVPAYLHVAYPRYTLKPTKTFLEKLLLHVSIPLVVVFFPPSSIFYFLPHYSFVIDDKHAGAETAANPYESTRSKNVRVMV